MLIGIGSIAALAVGAKYGANHYIKHICKNKLVLQSLPEKLDFKEAKTVEEGIKYAKEVLKIKDVSPDFSLDAINYVNRALTDVSNVHKGNVYMPSALKFESMKDMDAGALAGVSIMPFTKDFSSLILNKDFFNHQYLDDYLKKYLYKTDGSLRYANGSVYKSNDVYFKTTNELQGLLDKYYKNPNSLTFNEKLDLKESLFRFNEKLYFKNVNTVVEKSGQETKFLRLKRVSGAHTIYHELGHLQDAGAHMSKNGISYMRRGVPSKIFTTGENKKFMASKEEQEAALKVSEYAQTSIDEFLAETYGQLLGGEKLPEDVMKLYEKYHGSKVS